MPPLTPTQIKDLSQAEVLKLQPFVDCISTNKYSTANKTWSVILKYRKNPGEEYQTTEITLPGQS